MSKRLYKKQAKRAVELLRSHGVNVDDYEPDPYGDMRGIPVRWVRTSYEYDEWDTAEARSDWIEHHYWNIVVPPNYFKSGDEPWPSMTLDQRRERFSTSAIAQGWRWRGGRAVPMMNTKG